MIKTGTYILNRRAIQVGDILYPMPHDASKLILSWEDGRSVTGEINQGTFYPFAKNENI